MKKWIVLTLPMLVVFALWLTIHSQILRWDAAMGGATTSLTLGSGCLEINAMFADSWHKKFFTNPSTSFSTLSYDEVNNPPIGLCMYDNRSNTGEELDPFAEKPADPFRGNYPTAKQTAFGEPFAI